MVGRGAWLAERLDRPAADDLAFDPIVGCVDPTTRPERLVRLDHLGAAF